MSKNHRRICLYCGAKFKQEHSEQEYCDTHCRMQAEEPYEKTSYSYVNSNISDTK